MSYGLTQLGPRAINHSNNDAEAEYDRLRGLAREEANKRSRCFDEAHQAYERDDGATAHQKSEEGKQHAARMAQYNKQASEFIFRENNADGRVDSDTIDLHGQFVEEAEDILEERIKYAQAHGQTHLHVIVGKGNHSANHIQKIKPRVERVCLELGLQYKTEPNAGRVYINLQGGPADIPQQHHTGGTYHGGDGQQQQAQNDEIEQFVAKKVLPSIFRELKACCIMM
ncbi:MAG: hypothetical protein M1813_006795 [Trichoglossum hirsutum]|nr:MAG: hypothetical protein M1813_006795 [Trichoglossum hirsutum]